MEMSYVDMRILNYFYTVGFLLIISVIGIIWTWRIEDREFNERLSKELGRPYPPKDKTVVNRIESKIVYSEEIGKYTTRFYYRLEKETGASKDGISPVYCMQTIQHKNKINYDNFSNFFREEIAKSGECSIEYVVPITKKQYQKEMEMGGRLL